MLVKFVISWTTNKPATNWFLTHCRWFLVDPRWSSFVGDQQQFRCYLVILQVDFWNKFWLVMTIIDQLESRNHLKPFIFTNGVLCRRCNKYNINPLLNNTNGLFSNDVGFIILTSWTVTFPIISSHFMLVEVCWWWSLSSMFLIGFSDI